MRKGFFIIWEYHVWIFIWFLTNWLSDRMFILWKHNDIHFVGLLLVFHDEKFQKQMFKKKLPKKQYMNLNASFTLLLFFCLFAQTTLEIYALLNNQLYIIPIQFKMHLLYPLLCLAHATNIPKFLTIFNSRIHLLPKPAFPHSPLKT